MKKLFPVILSLLIFCVWISGASGGMLIRKVSGGGGADYTDCSQLDNYELYWNGDHATSTVTGCKVGGTITGTLTGATVVDSNSDPGTESPNSGNNVLKHDATSERLVFTITSKDIFDSAQGHVKISFYIGQSLGSQARLFQALNGSNYLRMCLNTNDTAQISGNGGSGVEIISTDTINTGAWNTIEIKWDASLGASNSEVFVKVNSGGWLGDSDADDYTAWAAEPTTVIFGHYTDATAAYFDNIYIDTSCP